MDDVSSFYPATSIDSVPVRVREGRHHSADEYLLQRYLEYMNAEGVPYTQRKARLDSAREFLLWRHMLTSGQERCAPGSEDRHADSGFALSQRREMYLSEVCPDRDLRAEERFRLNPFLRFAETLGNQLLACL